MSSALAPQQPPSVPLSAYAALATLSIGVLSAFCMQCLCDTTHLALDSAPSLASAPLSTCVPWASCIQRFCGTTHFVVSAFPRLLALLLCLLLPLLASAKCYSQQRMPGDPKMDPHNTKYKKKGKSRRGSFSLSSQMTLFKFGREIWPLQLWILVYVNHIHVVSSVPILLVSTRSNRPAALLDSPTASYALKENPDMAPEATKTSPTGNWGAWAHAQARAQEPGHADTTQHGATGAGGGEWGTWAQAQARPQEPGQVDTTQPMATGTGSGEWGAVGGVAKVPGPPQEPSHPQPRAWKPQTWPPPRVPQHEAWIEAKGLKRSANAGAVSLTDSESSSSPERRTNAPEPSGPSSSNAGSEDLMDPRRRENLILLKDAMEALSLQSTPATTGELDPAKSKTRGATPADSCSATPRQVQSEPASPRRGSTGQVYGKKRRSRGATHNKANRETAGKASMTVGGPLADREGDIPVEEYEENRYEFCQGAYWVYEHRLAWCTTCGAYDDWKVMKQEWVEELTEGEMAVYVQSRVGKKCYARIHRGNDGGIRKHTCTACCAKKDGVHEAQALNETIRTNKSGGSIARATQRVDAYRDAFDKLTGNFDVLAAFAVEGDEQLAFRKATQGVGKGIDKASFGCPAPSQEVAEETGKPMDVDGGGGYRGRPRSPLPRRPPVNRRPPKNGSPQIVGPSSTSKEARGTVRGTDRTHLFSYQTRRRSLASAARRSGHWRGSGPRSPSRACA